MQNSDLFMRKSYLLRISTECHKAGYQSIYSTIATILPLIQRVLDYSDEWVHYNSSIVANFLIDDGF